MNDCTGCPKKKRDLRILTLHNDLCSQYFIHVANKYRSGIFMILAFHGIFHFYSTPFRSLAVVPQRTSLLTSPAVIFYLYSNVLKKSDQVNGGRPDHSFFENSLKLCFCGVKAVCHAVRPLPYLLSLIECVNFIRVYFRFH